MDQKRNNIPFNILSFSVKSGEINNYLNKVRDYCVIKKNIYTGFGLHKQMNIIPMEVMDDADVGLEIWIADSVAKKVNDNLVIFDSSFGKWAFLSGIRGKEGASFEDQVRSVLEQSNSLLNDIGFSFAHLVRTWFYIGGLLEEEKGMVRYDILNSIRDRFYDHIWHEKKDYPASTGIGMAGEGIIMEGIAIIPSSDISIKRIENPLQISAYNYKTKYSPKFCRAVFLESKYSGIMFISGTASIRKDKVMFPDDVEKQTIVTIENIKELISRKNLSRYGIDWKTCIEDIKFIKVYIKEKKLFPKVKNICKSYFGNIPQLYLKADICRKELLVEIEAILIKD